MLVTVFFLSIVTLDHLFFFVLYGHGEACDGPDGVDFGNFPLLAEHPRPRRHEDGGHEEVDHATVSWDPLGLLSNGAMFFF